MHAIQLKYWNDLNAYPVIKTTSRQAIYYSTACKVKKKLTSSYTHGLCHCLVLVCPIVWAAFNKPKGRFLQDRITPAPLLLSAPICTHAACQAQAGALHSNTTNPCLLYTTAKPHTKYIPHDEDKTNSVDLRAVIDQWQ